MKSISRFGAIILVVTLASLWQGWNDGWYAIAGLVTAGIPLAVLTIWRCSRTSHRARGVPEADATDSGDPIEYPTIGNEPAGVRESIFVGGFQGFAFGVALSVYLAGSFALLQKIPWLYDRYYDSDRSTVEAQIATLERAGNHAEAVTAIEDRLKRKSGVDWRRAMVERLYNDLVQMAQQVPTEQRLPVLEKALGLASENHMDDTSARTLQTQALRERSLAARIEELQGNQDWDAVTRLLESELLRAPDSTATAQQLCDSYCTAAVHAESLDRQAELYQKVEELAKQYKLPADRARAALAKIKELQAAQVDQARQARVLAEMDQEGAETRRELFEAMLKGGLEHLAPDLRLGELKRIAALAGQYRVDLPSLEKQIDELDKSVANQREFIKNVAQLRNDGKHEEAVNKLAAAVRSGNRRQWIQPYDAALLENLDAWCHTADHLALEKQSERLLRVVEVAKQCGLECSVLKRRLDEVSIRLVERQRTTSIELPAGSNAGIVRVSNAESPFLVADLFVEDSNGTPIPLATKDLKVTVDGQSVPFFMQPVAVDPVPGYVAIVVDTSGSVAPALAEVKSAVAGLAGKLCQGNSLAKLITFGSTVNAEYAWTTDAAEITKSVHSLRADGGTAMYLALRAAALELARRPVGSERTIILFSDGADSIGGVALDEIMQQLQSNEIKMFAIGLGTKELDRSVLQKVSNGQFVEAANVRELTHRFADARSFY